jgi:hypothetical protein
MGMACLTACPECNRHLRCGERACPFCGARVSSFLRVLEYRLKTRLSRGQAFSLGAALTAAGFVTSCNENGNPMYGLACAPTVCPDPKVGGSGGTTGGAGSPNLDLGGSANGGVAGRGGASGGAGDGGQMTGNAGETTGGAETSGGDANDENAGGSAGGSR